MIPALVVVHVASVGTVGRRSRSHPIFADLAAYEEVARGNIEYDKTQKAFLPTRSFKPRFLTVSADRYLAQLNAIRNDAVVALDTWFGSPPPAAVMPALHTVDPIVLQRMLEAIRKLGAISVEYQSLANTRRRKIAPHALAFDGYRWHVRAWCLDRREFRDFVLTRMNSDSVGEVEEFDSNAMKDIEWQQTVDLKIVPHPKLSKAQQDAVARDFGMINGTRILPAIRIALTYYVIKRLDLDLDLEEIGNYHLDIARAIC